MGVIVVNDHDAPVSKMRPRGAEVFTVVSWFSSDFARYSSEESTCMLQLGRKAAEDACHQHESRYSADEDGRAASCSSSDALPAEAAMESPLRV
ncbi:MAG: hypothetical protein ACLRX5_02520 [Slackia sp.]